VQVHAIPTGTHLEDRLSSCSPSLSHPPGPSPASSLFRLLVDPLLFFVELLDFSLSFLLLEDLFSLSRLGVGLLLLDGLLDLDLDRDEKESSE